MFHIRYLCVFYKSTKPQPVDTRHANQPVDVESIKNIPSFIGFQNIPKKWYKTVCSSNHTEFPFFLGLSSEVFPAQKAKHSGRVGKCESPDHQHHKYEVPERKLLEHSKSKVMMLPFVHPPPDKIQKIISFFGAPCVWDRGAGGREMRHTFFISANQILNKSTEKLWQMGKRRCWKWPFAIMRLFEVSTEYCNKKNTHTHSRPFTSLRLCLWQELLHPRATMLSSSKDHWNITSNAFTKHLPDC